MIVVVLCLIFSLFGQAEEHGNASYLSRHHYKPLEVYTLNTDRLQRYRDQILIVSLSESTDQAFGAYLAEEGHSRRIVELLELLEQAQPKGVIIDHDWFKNVSREHRVALGRAIARASFPVVLAADSPDEEGQFSDDWGSVPEHAAFGHSRYRAIPKSQKGALPIRRKMDEDHHWPHPKSQFFAVQMRPKRDKTPSLSYSLLSRLEPNLPKDPFELFVLRHFSEAPFKVTPIERALSETAVDRMQGKYLLIGKDYEDMDTFQSSEGSQYNGVYLHAEQLATLLHVRDLDPKRNDFRAVEVIAPPFRIPLYPEFDRD